MTIVVQAPDASDSIDKLISILSSALTKELSGVAL